MQIGKSPRIFSYDIPSLEKLKEATVPIIFLRARPNSDGRRNFANAKFAKEREDITRTLAEACGFEMLEFCKSLGSGEMVAILKGPADRLMLMKQIMDQTGAFDTLQSELLEPVQVMVENEGEIRRLSPSFKPPDVDEIDQMLLEEC